MGYGRNLIHVDILRKRREVRPFFFSFLLAFYSRRMKTGFERRVRAVPTLSIAFFN